MKRLSEYLFVKQRHNWVLLLRFGMVGASGVFVNLAVLTLVGLAGPDYDNAWIDLPATDFNIRYYHLYATIAFIVANVWNFQLNRGWTFASGKHAGWWDEYVPFFLVGLGALAVNLLILTIFMHPDSLVSFPQSWFDDSHFYSSRLTWAQFVAIAIVTPLSFVMNKLWTFSSVRSQVGGRGA